jgi:hypothetical protein
MNIASKQEPLTKVVIEKEMPKGGQLYFLEWCFNFTTKNNKKVYR